MPARPRLYLIDGYSNIFRGFYAIRNLSNSKGEPTNAVYGFINMLRKLLREEQPELVGVALDSGQPTVRSDRYAEYKSNRQPTPPDLLQQIPRVRAAIEAYRIPILELRNWEADDVLGTLARRAAADGYDVVLVSADKDLMQLVDDHVFIYHTGRNKLYDRAAVEADFGVPPEKVRDVLALMGDSVDNVPGVKGIGDKGARDLIQQYGSLEELLDRAAEVSRKAYREGLIAHRDDALMSKELVTIHTDLPVEFDPAALRLDPPDTDALRKLFTELEFFSLVEELGPSAAAPSAGIDVAREVTTAAEWAALEIAPKMPLPIATVGEPPLGLAIGIEGGVRFADFRRDGLRAAVGESLESWLADPERELVGHDLKEVLRLSPRGREARSRLFDAMLVSYVIKPALRGHGLEEIALDRLGRQAMTAKEAGFDKQQVPLVGDDRLLAFAAERALLPARFEGQLREELGEGKLARVYRDIEAPLAPVLVGMEEAGVRLDLELLARLSREMGDELATLEADIYRLAGESFNINSPQQLGAILFERLGYPVLGRSRKTKSYSTGAEILEELAARGYPLPERLLRFREVQKLKSTYVDSLPLLADSNQRVHTRYLQAVAATGRLSSVNPNLQNIPVRSGIGQRIREAFIAAPGHLLLVADYSQIELRILAHIAQEPALVESFQRGDDIHRATAANVFGVAPELVTADQRRAAKVINFGILYGMSAFGLGKNLGIPTGEADRFIKAYLERFPNVRRYVDETMQAAQRDGKVETLYGRVRYLPDVNSKNFNLRESARRMAINAPIQGTAADIQKLALIAVDRALRADHPAARLLLTVHDELVVEVPADSAEETAARVRREMEGIADLAVPLVVETGCAENWSAAKE